MAQTKEGAELAAARKIGIDVELFRARILAGLKHCYACRRWRLVAQFGVDRSRGDGRAAICVGCRKVRAASAYKPRQKVSKIGARFVPARDHNTKDPSGKGVGFCMTRSEYEPLSPEVNFDLAMLKLKAGVVQALGIPSWIHRGEDLMNEQEWLASHRMTPMLEVCNNACWDDRRIAIAETLQAKGIASYTPNRREAEACDLIREVVGNPWEAGIVKYSSRGYHEMTRWHRGETRGVVIEQIWLEWKAGAIPKAVKAVYDGVGKDPCVVCGGGVTPTVTCPRCIVCDGTGYVDADIAAPTELAVIADMLEEAGCSWELLLRHLREGRHVRHCWALALLAGPVQLPGALATTFYGPPLKDADVPVNPMELF